jgi:hypothetical protein
MRLQHATVVHQVSVMPLLFVSAQIRYVNLKCQRMPVAHATHVFSDHAIVVFDCFSIGQDVQFAIGHHHFDRVTATAESAPFVFGEYMGGSPSHFAGTVCLDFQRFRGNKSLD